MNFLYPRRGLRTQLLFSGLDQDVPLSHNRGSCRICQKSAFFPLCCFELCEELYAPKQT